jgi:hypothetical protein
VESQKIPGQFLNIKTLVFLDMAWLGAAITIAEYLIGVLGCAAFGLLAVQGEGWVALVGVWLLAISCNYVPLLLHAVSFALRPQGRPQRKELESWSREEMGRYRVRQLLILVPLAVIVLDLIQRRAGA